MLHLVLAGLLLFAGVASTQEQPRTFKIPFHSVNNLILLDAKVNGKPAVLLLDTGAQFAMVDQNAIGLVVNLRAFELATRGARGEYVKHIAELDLGGFHWKHNVLVVNLSQESKQFGAHIDGYVGQDLLREFSAVRIDYKTGLVEFER